MQELVRRQHPHMQRATPIYPATSANVTLRRHRHARGMGARYTVALRPTRTERDTLAY
jgi:hypothetical protein